MVAQAFTATPLHHAPAVVVGLMPAIAGWAALIAKNSLRAAGMGTLANPLTPALIEKFTPFPLKEHGFFLALSKLFT